MYLVSATKLFDHMFKKCCILILCTYSYSYCIESKCMLTVESLTSRSSLFSTINCCALFKTVQYAPALWIYTDTTWHSHYYYFISITCSYLYTNICIIVMCYQVFFSDYFQPNSAIHVYTTRSLDKLHLYTVNSSFGLKCINVQRELDVDQSS